ncbi:hypothetical protein MO973_11680 [Paenibacillus sp. TRM 82003]|nr:hypothetical protein [Paenibacillus sp. TRM 82003]
MRRAIAGHVARWLLIVGMAACAFFMSYGLEPWRPEPAIKASLESMDLPGDVVSVSDIEVGELHSIVFWDERHGLYHMAWMRRDLGLAWHAQGGGYGMTLEPEKYRIRYGEGFSSRPKGTLHYVLGQVNDERVATVEVHWRDGTSERRAPAIGRIIHFAREGRPGDSTTQAIGLTAYDADGMPLYALDNEHTSVLTEETADGASSSEAKQPPGVSPVTYTIERQGDGRTYGAGEPVLFSDPNAAIIFSFDGAAADRMVHVDAWYPEARVYYEENGAWVDVPLAREVQELSDTRGEIRIDLKDAPRRDLQLVLHGEVSIEPIRRTLSYVEPLTATLSGEDPYLRTALRFRGEQSIPWWAAAGEEHRLRVAFSSAMERGSVERRIDKIFASDWKASWADDRTVDITFRINEVGTGIGVDLSGVRSDRGYVFVDRMPLQIYASPVLEYGAYSLKTGKTGTLFHSSQPFLKLLPNRDGTLALGQLLQDDEAGASLHVLLDLREGGKIRRVFELGELGEPLWLGKDPNAFVYEASTAEKRSIRMYIADKDVSREIWSLPSQGGTMSWVRPLTLPGSDKIWAMDYRALEERYAFPFSADLYELPGPDDAEARVTKDVHRSVCEGATCYGVFLPLSERLMFMVQSEPSAEAGREYQFYDLNAGTRTTLLREEVRLFTPLDDETYLIVDETMTADGRTQYRYSLLTPDLSDEPIALFESERIPGYTGMERGAKIGDNRFIVGDGVLDVESRTFERLDFEPMFMSGDTLYWRK